MATGQFAYANNSNRFLGAPALERQPFAICGLPFDGAVTNRPGARFGPQEIRRASLMLCDGIHPLFDVSPLGQLGDAGDMRLPNASPLSEVRVAIQQQAAALMAAHHCVFIGGDHSVTLPLLRALHAQQGPVALVHFDAHCDTWSEHFGEPSGHGTWTYEAIQEGLVQRDKTVQIGIRSSGERSAREYVTGDAPGRIHWRLSARRGELVVREPERTAASSLTVFVDASAGGPTFVDSAVRLAASLLREGQTLGLPVAAAAGGQVTPAGRGTDALHAALHLLARVQPDPGQPRLPATRAGGNLIILTARPSADLTTQALRARATASRVSIVALPEGFYLEPGEQPRRQWAGLPDAVRDLERRAAVLAESGILVYVLRGNQSVLTLAG